VTDPQGASHGPASVVLTALASGSAEDAADSASDAVKAAYSQLKRLITDRFRCAPLTFLWGISLRSLREAAVVFIEPDIRPSDP
jgi:hypothetical protein